MVVSADAAVERAASACTRAVDSLREAKVPLEGIAEYVPARRVMLIPRAATMRQLGEGWHIAPLLLGSDGLLHFAGRTTRAAQRRRSNHQSLSQENRRDIAAAALRGGYAEGAVVNYDAAAIPLDPEQLTESTGPVCFAAGEVRVRWHTSAPADAAPTLEQFLRDRVSLMIEARGTVT